MTTLAQIQATRDTSAKRHRVNLPLQSFHRPVSSQAGIQGVLRSAMANVGAKARAF